MMKFKKALLTLSALCSTLGLSAETQSLQLPSIFGDHMVLQRDAPLPIWGWSKPGEKVVVQFAGQSATSAADTAGKWKLKLEPVALQNHSLSMSVTTSGGETLQFSNILMGDVWLCSGQSNMGWPIGATYDSDLVTMSANNPSLRLITVPNVGTQELQEDFKGAWAMATPETVKQFSAVAYHFGKQVTEVTGIPIGLINNAWGGSSADAWIRRDVYESDPVFAGELAKWQDIEKNFNLDEEIAKWEKRVAKARAEGKPIPRKPNDRLKGQHRPGNLYAGKLYPLMPFGIKGAIWYQGESNSGRAYQYRHMFPKMITHWRKEWGQGDFPFYWAQLADFREEQTKQDDSTWAELREAQTMTLKLPNTGQAVIHDVGEGRDIHPRDKESVGRRLARLALANDYGVNIVSKSPSLEKLEREKGSLKLIFTDVGSKLYSFDSPAIKGFEVAGKDQVWHSAKAELLDNQSVKVSSESVADPVAARYAWADNPVANLESWEGLPVTPFRTDDWKRSTQPTESE